MPGHRAPAASVREHSRAESSVQIQTRKSTCCHGLWTQALLPFLGVQVSQFLGRGQKKILSVAVLCGVFVVCGGTWEESCLRSEHPRILLLPPLLLIEGSYMCCHIQFYVASGDLNSALHACVASTLSSVPLFQTRRFERHLAAKPVYAA